MDSIGHWHVIFHVFDGGLVVASRGLEVALLVHDRTDVGQADTLLAVVVVEFLIDVQGVPVLEQSLRLLLFCHLAVHGGVSDVGRANDSVECVLEIIQLLARGSIGKLYDAIFIAFALGLNLIQSFVEVDDALSDLISDLCYT